MFYCPIWSFVYHPKTNWLNFSYILHVNHNEWHFKATTKIEGDDGLFEGDMRLTDDQLDALKWGSFEPRGDLGRVTRFPTFFFFRKYNSKSQKLEGNCGQNAISKRHHWGQIPLAKQHSQVHLLWSASYIPHICQRHHKKFLPGVIFSRLNVKSWHFTV